MTQLQPSVRHDSTIQVDINPIDGVSTVTVDGFIAYVGDIDGADKIKATFERQRDRALQINGLRQLADYLEENPDLPIWYAHIAGGRYDLTRVEFLTHVHTLNVEPIVSTTQNQVEARRVFDGDVDYTIRAPVEKTCTPAVVDDPWSHGKRKVIWSLLTDAEQKAIASHVEHGTVHLARERFGDGLVDHYFRVIEGIDPDAARSDDTAAA